MNRRTNLGHCGLDLKTGEHCGGLCPRVERGVAGLPCGSARLRAKQTMISVSSIAGPRVFGEAPGGHGPANDDMPITSLAHHLPPAGAGVFGGPGSGQTLLAGGHK